MSQISIILPSYNGEKYISESVNSIINQSFKDWELILVDDCSTDSTLEIMNSYAKQDSRIKVIHNKVNCNLPNSLNIGFKSAQGEFLTWTSDDNIYEIDALKEMFTTLSKSIVPMVVARMYYINDFGDIIKEAPTYHPRKFWYNNNVGACFLYRRSVLNTIGEYNSNLFGIEDYEYWIRILMNYEKIELIDKVLYKYRIHEKSLSNTKFYNIKQMLNSIRERNLDYICKKLNQEELMGLYFDMLLSDLDISKIKARITISESSFYKKFNRYNKKVLIYGAGEYGKRSKMLFDDIIAFVDSDPNKIGKVFEGKKIISFNTYKELYSDCQLVVSVDALNLFSIAREYHQYHELEITTFHQVAHLLIFHQVER